MSRILVVDDDPDIRNLVGAFLKAEGHSVDFAVNGILGVGAALSEMPDLIVTDFQMPGMDGFALFNAVRANAEKKVPVVMITAHNSRALMQKALSLGIDDFIGKPITRDELQRVVAPLMPSTTPRAARPAPITRTLATTKSSGTVVCVDICRLESFMMTLDKAELAELLDQFRTSVAQAVQEDGGWLVRRKVHHLLMGFPEEGASDHAVRAVRCALKAVLLAQRLKPWIARRFAGRDLPEFLVAVGIHSGAIQVRAPRGGDEGELKGEAVDVAALLSASILSLRWSVAASQAAAKASNFSFLAGRAANLPLPDGSELGAIEVRGFKVAGATPASAPPDRSATLVEAAVDRNATLVTYAAAVPKKAPEPVAAPVKKAEPPPAPPPPPPAPKAVAPATPPPPPVAPVAKPAPTPKPLPKIAPKPAAKSGQPSFAPPPPKVVEPPPPPPVDPFESRTVVIKLSDNGIATAHLTLPKAGGTQEVLKGFLINDDKKQTKRPSLHKFVAQYEVFRGIEHPNIARTTDIGLSATHMFVAQEYCAGGDLHNLIAQGMSPDDAVKVLLRVSSALKAAHQKGFVHGDLRPSNVMIREDGSFAVVDFALARVVEYAVGEGESGVLLRSPEYLPPEVINGEPADARSDIYCLGLLLHEMLTGKKAYASPDLSKVMMDQLNAPVPVLPAPHEKFQPLLDKLMAKEMASRFASVNDVIGFMADAKLQG